ncbi:hypothetical protein [Parasitella parasitica]|uniref:Uncharacterized protein n=1 Tax=Parasitella parasitica TaxID=35722 RepID=A0A0B7NFI2_9FUNG|nr:hypothetical protein [Parasitella parasitica]
MATFALNKSNSAESNHRNSIKNTNISKDMNKNTILHGNTQIQKQVHTTEDIINLENEQDRPLLTPPSSPETAPLGSESNQETAFDNSHPKSSTYEYNNRILAAKRKGDIRTVMMEYNSMKMKSVKITLHTYNLVIEAHALLRPERTPLTKMLKTYDEMIQAHIQPNAYTYTLLIRNLCKRDVEVQKTVAMLKRQSARGGHQINDVGILEAEGNLDKALEIFHCAVADNVSVNTFDVELFNQLLRVLSHYGATSDATFVYSQLEQSAVQAKPNSATYSALINLFGRAGDIDMALYYYGVYTQVKETLGPHDTSYIFNALVDCHLKCGLLDGALHVVEHEMVDNGIKLTSIPYNSIIRHYCNHGQMSEAEALIERLIQGHKQDAHTYPRPDSSSYGPILSAYCKADEWEAATRVYDALRKTDISKAYGNLANYALLCVTHQDRKKALCVIEDMRKANLEPDPTLTERIITSFAQADQVEQAVIALNTLQQIMCPRSLARGFHQIMNGALEVVSHCVSVHQVLAVMQAVLPLTRSQKIKINRSKSPSPTAYEIMSKTLVDLYSDQAKESQLLLTLTEFQTVFDAAFIAYEHKETSSLCDFALQLVQDMRASDLTLPLSIYNSVLAQLHHHDDFKSVSRWKNAFEPQLIVTASENPATSLHASDDDEEEDIIIEIAEDNDQGLALLRAGSSPAATTANSTSVSATISNEILKAIENNKCHDAICIFENNVIQAGIIPIPETMRDVIALAGKKGDIDTALTIYNKSIYAFKDIADIQTKSKAIYMVTNSLLVVYAQKGDMNEAKVYYSRIKAMGFYPDSNGYASLLLCSAKCGTDEATDALEIYNEAKSYNVQPTTFFYNVIISKLAKARKLDSALTLFDEMRKYNVQANSITYGAIISACVRSGSETQSRRLFDEMLSSSSYQPRVGPFNNMMQFYIHQIPNRDQVLKYFSELRRRRIKPSPHTYKLLMEAYANIPLYNMPMAHKQLSDMERLHHIHPQATHYATLIYSYGNTKRDIQSAERVFSEMEKAKIRPDEAVYQAMIDALINNNALERAEKLYYEKMQKDTQLKKSGSPYIENLLIRGYGEKGQLDQAEKIFAAMSDDKSKKNTCVVREPSTYEAMIIAYRDNNKKDQAEGILAQMRKRDFPCKVIKTAASLLSE